LLLAAAAACGGEFVKEATKDAYGQLKERVGGLFGQRAARAVVKLEDEATREEGRQELQRYLPDKLEPSEATQLEPLVSTLVRALKEDEVASQMVHSRIGLDLDISGDALIRDIQGAREVAVKAKTAGDFTLEGVRMDTGRDAGK
jgi:hypothetical protein